MQRVVFALSVAFAVAACAGDEPALGERAAPSTVAEHVTTTCTTAVVLELSRQIAGEVGCLVPGQLVAFAEGNGVVFTGAAILPYVSEAARTDLLDAVAAGGGRDLELTSVYRTVVQQYLLYRWFQLGRCGIPAAATPGNSNHESGRAIDVSNWAAWIDDLGDHGWGHTVPGDDVHFDHTASPDLRGTDVLAFQRLWNRNQPGRLLDEDGDYGPLTEAAIEDAPAEGFAIGPACGAAGLAVAVERIEAPRTVATGAGFRVEITVRNTGTVAWPAGTALVTAEPLARPSPIAAPSWPAPGRAAVLDAAVAVGEVVTFGFDAVAPAVAIDTELTEGFTLAVGGEHVGAVALVVTVTARGGADGGCATGGGAGPATVLVVLAMIARRPRRRRAAPARG